MNSRTVLIRLLGEQRSPSIFPVLVRADGDEVPRPSRSVCPPV
ncbi:hypothetical protein ACFVY4_05905 [Streptomyces sp. NPDC058299]